MAQKLRVLLLEDEEDDAELLAEQLRSAGFQAEITRAVDEAEYLTGLDHRPDVILADYSLPQFDAPRALRLLQAKNLDIPFVVVTGSVGEERAVSVMRSGAADYLLKDRLTRLGPAIERALADRDAREARRRAEEAVERLKNQLEDENEYLREEIKHSHDFERILGQSSALREALRRVELVAATDATVLVLGETGTGKELFARAIHSLSRRKSRPLVKVNCAALPPNLIESELFGHDRGAFTGALSKRRGRFELAHGSTLFLDEIGELPLETQGKLLRVLQEGEFERVGSSQVRQVDVRTIAASNRDLEAGIARGEFRADLFYRLNVFPIHLAPLRQRPSDIPLLARYFAEQAAKRLGKRFSNIADKDLNAMVEYDWPGNVRELQNIIERAVILSDDGHVHIPDMTRSRDKRASASGTDGHGTDGHGERLEEVERAHITRVLEQTRWRIQGPNGAAERLGVNPNTLRSRMQKMGITRPN